MEFLLGRIGEHLLIVDFIRRLCPIGNRYKLYALYVQFKIKLFYYFRIFLDVNMQCKHCKEIVSFDDAEYHSCFIGKDVYMDSENNLFTNAEETNHTEINHVE